MDILLVDDSRTMRMIVQRAIRQAGYRRLVMEEAENGFQALEKVAAKQPRLVVSDWNMPGMLGVELLSNLRASGNQVPFGFVTSECTPEMMQQADAAGSAFFIVKPFTSERFEEVFSSILG